MKTVAVIKNELFGNYVRIVSTSDLSSLLNSPDVPVAYECITGVEMSDMVATAVTDKVRAIFDSEKITGKDFFNLSEERMGLLTSIMEIAKLASAGLPSEALVSQSMNLDASNDASVSIKSEEKDLEQKQEELILTGGDKSVDTTTTNPPKEGSGNHVVEVDTVTKKKSSLGAIKAARAEMAKTSQESAGVEQVSTEAKRVVGKPGLASSSREESGVAENENDANALFAASGLEEEALGGI